MAKKSWSAWAEQEAKKRAGTVKTTQAVPASSVTNTSAQNTTQKKSWSAWAAEESKRREKLPFVQKVRSAIDAGTVSPVSGRSLDGWLKDVDVLTKRAREYYSGWNGMTPDTDRDIRKIAQNYLALANDYRAEYAGDEKSLKAISAYEKGLNDLLKYAEPKHKDAQGISSAYGISDTELEKKLADKDNPIAFTTSEGEKISWRGAKEQKDLSRLYGLSSEDLEKEQAKSGSGVAYTTMDGQNITWNALLRSKKKEEQYADLSSRDDWNELSKYKSTIPSADADYNDPSLQAIDWAYELVNNPEYSSDRSDTFRAKYMTDEEREVFNYLYHTEGKDAALEWQYDLMHDLEELRSADIAKKANKYASQGFPQAVASWIGARAAAPLAAFEYVGDLVDSAFTGRSVRNDIATRNAAVDKAITDNVDMKIGNFDVFDFGYGTATSMVDSALSSVLGSIAGPAVLGLSAAAAATNAALDRGMDQKEAVKTGVLAGFWEGFFEHFSIGNFKKLQAVDPKRAKDYVFNTIKSMGINASEEGLTEIANAASDIYFNGDFSDYETSIRMNIQSGMTEEEARKEANKNLALQIAESAASGALMGIGFGAGGSAIGHAKAARQAKKLYGSDAGALVQKALEIDPENAYAKQMQEKLKGSKNNKLSGSNLAFLAKQNEASLVESDKAKIQQAAKARLTELGATEDVDAVADALMKQAIGEKLTRRERDLIELNRYAPQVAEELNPAFQNLDRAQYDAEWAESHDNRWVQQIGTERINAEYYNRLTEPAQIAPETQETEGNTVLDPNENIAEISNEAAESPVSNKNNGEFLNEETKNATRKENLQVAEESAVADRGEISKARKERAVSVVSLENGEMHVKRENGETVNAKSYRADGSDQVYETIRNISSDVEEANTYVQAYAASPVSAETFEKGLRLAQMYGAKNFPIEELESTSAGKLPENIRTMAYDHAQQSVQAAEAFLTEIGMSSESIKSVFAESPMDGRVDLNDMANGIRVAFQYGVVGIDKAKAPAGSDGLKLTDAQWNIAYQDGRAYARKHTDTVQTQNQTRKISKVKADKNTKVVNGVKYHGVSVSKRAMNERQRAGIKIAELLASMGMDVHLHQSIMDLNGRYVFTDDAGVYRSDNGFYRKRDGSIHIDVNAGIDGEGLLAYTLSHELTHFIEDWSPEKFKLYADTLISELGKTEADVDADLNRMINRIKNDPQYSELTEQEKQDIAYSELIAEYSETMLANTDVLKRIAEKIKAKDKRLAQKIRNFFADIVKKLREAYKDYKPNSRLAQEAAETIRNVDTLAEAFADVVVDAADRFAKAEAVLNESGVAIDAETDTAILESARYAPKNQEEIDTAANALSQRLGVSFQEARAWVENEVSIASLILNPKFDDLELSAEEQAEWDKLDYKSDGRRTAIKKNAEYKQGTLDFSNICRKRREYTSMMNRIQKAFPNHIFTASELAQIRKIMLEEGIEVACGICYVEDRRQNDTAIAKGFVDALERYRNGETTHEDGKPFNKNQLKALRMVGEDSYVPTLYELTTREGLNELRKSDHESIAKAWETFNNARGMQAVRLLENEAEYKRQILKYNDRRVKRINDLGGLRIFSFSDFEEFHLIDIIQAIQDCAAMGIKIQGYTKVPSFAKLLKDTGVKLNRSLIAKGDLGYRIENGKVVLEYDTVEGIDINSEDFFDSTDNPNVGNILVGINYEQISAAMLDDFVDYIIPFHTGQGKEVLTAKNISAWKNYKDSQTDKDIATGTTAKKQINIYTDVLNASEKEGNPITDKVTFVQKFLDVCKERGIKPRFAEFLNVDSNGDYAYREGYHKFLVDFKMFDKDGNILPQNTVKPEFDNAYMTKLLTDYVKREAAKEAELSPKLDKAYNRVLDEVVKAPKTKQDVTLSSPRESDTDSVQELTVNDVAKTQNGSLMVNINSRASGLSGHRKGEWPRIVSEMIRNTLSGKSIITEEGDIITVTRRGAREVGFGTDTQVLKTDARQSRDYSKVEQKMITAEHTASIIALSKYDTWSANNEDPTDSFKKDGLNYRKVDLLIDGVPHTATVVTALNGDPKQRLDYGEKFYDIENIIEKQTNLSASYGTLVNRATPHIIKMADGSSDRLTVTQKQRIVNNKKSTYSSSGGAAKTATSIALEKALAQNSDHKDGNLLSQRDPDGGYSNRSLLANALESAVQHEVEAKRLAEYKAGIAEMSKQQKKLSELTEEWRSLMFAKGKRSAETKARIEALREEIDKTAVRINNYDKKLLGMEAAAPLQKVLEREKAKALKKAKEKEKAALKDQRTDFNERVKKQKLRSSVEKNAKSLMNMMSHPTKDAHVPNSMLEPLNEFLESIDFVSKQQSEGGEATIRDIAYTRALNGVRRAVEGQVSAMNGSDFAGEYALDINADFIKKIDEHIKEIEDATKKLDTGTNRVYAMNSAELKQLSEILRTINKAIRDIDKLHMQGAKARVSDLAADTKQELSRRKPVKTDDGGKAMWANYTPWHAFRRMGKSAQQIFKGLMQGQAKLAQNVNAVIEFTKKTYSAKEVKKWERDIHTVELSSGENVKLTTAQLMSFYCLSQREHALDHLTGGGIRVVTIEDGLKKIRQPNKFLLSLEDISKINELLMKNERAFAVAKELQKYMSSVGSDLINEISMARWDYMAATEKNYFPIKTDETSRDVKDPGQDTTNLWALLNKSFTKGLTEGANNAIYVESIFDVFADHMSEASEYNAFALPLVDAMRWFNYRERNKLDGTQVEDSGVHDTIKTVLGSAAVDYFRNLMTDINSSQKAGRHENIAGQILSRSKISSVGYNLRVMIQQPTAILRASLILDPVSLLKGTAHIRTKELVKEMQQYSGIALWKSMGYYDLNVSRSVKEQIKHDSSFIDKANNVGTWLPGKMDEVTWARIWAAAKAQVVKNQKLKGEALLKATAELFEEIVYQTQVADSVLTRSSLMRSKSQFMKEATSFMAEPTVSLNILLSAFQDYEDGHKTWDKVKRGVMIGFAGYAMSSIVNACITALADAWRDDDEYEEFHEKYLQALFGEESFFDGNLFAELNPLEKIVFVKDIFSVLKGYDVMPGYADLFKSGFDLVTNYQKFIEGRGTITLYGLIYNTLQVVGSVGGIGLSNIAREVVGVWNHTIGMMYPEMKFVRYDIERKNQIRNALEGGSLTDAEAMDLLVEEGVAENEDEAYFTVEKWKSEDPQHYSKYKDLFEAAKAGKSIDKALKVLTDHGVKEKDAISTLKSKIGEWYTGTEDVPKSINKQQTINMLKKYTDMKESEITAQVNKWTAVVVTGIKYEEIEEKFLFGEIKESRAIEMRVKYGGQTQKEAAAVVSKWKCEKDTGVPYGSLREEFVDGNITEKEAVNAMVKYGGIKQREAEETVTGWKAEKETGIAYGSIRESYLEGELTGTKAADMYMSYGGKSESEAEDAVAELEFEKEYGFKYNDKKTMYIDGEITESTLREALTEYGEKSTEEADDIVRAYDWLKENPKYDLTESQAIAYTKPIENYGISAKDAGIDPDTFVTYRDRAAACKGTDSNGDGKADTNSKKYEKLAVIDSLPLTPQQKDALYFQNGWARSKLWQAPWH